MVASRLRPLGLYHRLIVTIDGGGGSRRSAL